MRIKLVQSWIIGFVLYAFLSLIPGTVGKAFVCGWVFGFLPAIILVDGALTLAALLTFFASRLLLRDAIESRSIVIRSECWSEFRRFDKGCLILRWRSVWQQFNESADSRRPGLGSPSISFPKL